MLKKLSSVKNQNKIFNITPWKKNLTCAIKDIWSCYGKAQDSVMEGLYNGPKELPRSIYVSDILETLLKFGIDDLKRFSEGMSDYEIKEWRGRDPERLEVVSYLRDDPGLSKYVDAVDEAMTFTNQTRKTAKKNKK